MENQYTPLPEPGSPQDWLRYAKSDLALAQTRLEEDILPELLCFHTQQCAEKCFKAVLLKAGVLVERTHNLNALIDMLSDVVIVPEHIAQSSYLSDYAVGFRYPSDREPIAVDELHEAIDVAGVVLRWAQAIVNAKENQ